MEATQESLNVFLFLEESSPRKIFKEAIQQCDFNSDLSIFYFSELSYLLSLKENLPDIIFISCNLPCLKAKKCLTEIRKRERFDSVPVIIFSNSSYLEEINKVYDWGANLYIPKSVLAKERIKTMEAIFESKWRKNLLRRAKSRFVLSDILDDENNLTRHAS